MQGRSSAGRAGAGFGAAEMVAGRVGARAAGVCDALMRAWVGSACADDTAELRYTVVFSTTLIHLSGMLRWSTKSTGMTRGRRVHRGQWSVSVVGLRHNDEFADVFCSCGGWRGGHLSRCMPGHPGYHETTPSYCGYGHYGSQEATTAGHRRVVMRWSLMCSDRVDLRSSPMQCRRLSVVVS
jgi:hypothetical protein